MQREQSSFSARSSSEMMTSRLPVCSADMMAL